MSDETKKAAAEKKLAAEALAKVFERVRNNTVLLEGCYGPHDFRGEGSGTMRQYRCSRCKGVVTPQCARWYVVGLSHGKAIG